MKKNVIVIGSGASGMIAAISAARNGHTVRILEKMGKPGKKILTTGNGRCNLTNEHISIDRYHSGPDIIEKRPPKFMQSVFSRFSQEDTLEFFHSLGLSTVVEEEGRIFPRSQQAQSVVDVLKFELNQLEVPIHFNKRVESVVKEEKKYHITCESGKKYTADAIVVATGGMSYPITGSSGDGFEIAKSLGHTIVEPTHASVPFRVKSPLCQKLQGVKPVVEVTVSEKSTLLAQNTGTIMFAHFGLSGPVVMEISRTIGKYFSQNQDKNLDVSINFFPEYSKDELEKILLDRFSTQPKKILNKSFIGLLISKIAPAIFDIHDIDGEMLVSFISKEIREQIIQLLTAYPLELESTMGWDLAQFTAGGVSLNEINSQTMESKISSSLYFCGEVVDIDGDSGGFNLQWAWSSGWVAGSSI